MLPHGRFHHVREAVVHSGQEVALGVHGDGEAGVPEQLLHQPGVRDLGSSSVAHVCLRWWNRTLCEIPAFFRSLAYGPPLRE
jgi:hypothetical protein